MKSVYIVFSATPYKMGRFIRTVLHNEYNHVSIAFDEDLATMCSYARFHVDVPLYGGFVSESLCRHFYGNTSSRIKICRIELEEENYQRLREFVADMETGRGKYIYNTYSAMLAPLHIRCTIRNCYTCAEFVGDALSLAGFALPMGRYHSLQHTERLLAPYVIYEGTCADFVSNPDWGEDHFPQRMGRFSGAAATLRSFGRLTARAVVSIAALLIDIPWG